MTEVPDYAKGANGKPAVMVLAVDTNNFGHPVTEGNVVKNMAVFKTGKVKDSLGRQHEWTQADLDAMVNNFTVLREKNLFPNVPVRENHSRDVRQIGGYYQALRRDGDTLYADIEFTEPEMKARWDRKTYRSRSIEIGEYESNAGESFFPAVMGLAFCDIPAVEGLFSASVSAYSGNDDKEVVLFAAAPPVGGAGAPEDEAAEETAEKAHLAAVLVALHALASQVATNPDAHSAVLKVITAIEAMQTDEAGDTAASGAAAPPKSTTKAGAPVDTFKFSLDGREVDVAGDDSTRAVLSTFAQKVADLTAENATLKQDAETANFARRDADVEKWRDDKKILPAQVDGMKAYVKTLTDEQFTAHSALITATPALTITTEHGATGGDDAASTKASEIAKHRQTYSMLVHAGLTPEKLADSKPAKALAALGVGVED